MSYHISHQGIHQTPGFSPTLQGDFVTFHQIFGEFGEMEIRNIRIFSFFLNYTLIKSINITCNLLLFQNLMYNLLYFIINQFDKQFNNVLFFPSKLFEQFMMGVFFPQGGRFFHPFRGLIIILVLQLINRSNALYYGKNKLFFYIKKENTIFKLAFSL